MNWRTRRPEYHLKHPHNKTVAADDADGDCGPNQCCYGDEYKKFCAPAGRRLSFSDVGFLRNRCHCAPSWEASRSLRKLRLADVILKGFLPHAKARHFGLNDIIVLMLGGRSHAQRNRPGSDKSVSGDFLR